MEKEGIMNQTVRDFSKQMDIFQTVLIFLTALLVPTFLGAMLNRVFGAEHIVATNSQLIIGSIVNTALIMSALNLKGTAKIMGVITMPSIATILGGYVFQTASIYMVYMIPAIWVGNFALVYAYKVLVVKQQKVYWFAGMIGIVAKVAIIFGIFSILKIFHIFPDKLVSTLQIAMSTTQAITAMIGAGIAYILYKIENNK